VGFFLSFPNSTERQNLEKKEENYRLIKELFLFVIKYLIHRCMDPCSLGRGPIPLTCKRRNENRLSFASADLYTAADFLLFLRPSYVSGDHFLAVVIFWAKKCVASQRRVRDEGLIIRWKLYFLQLILCLLFTDGQLSFNSDSSADRQEQNEEELVEEN